MPVSLRRFLGGFRRRAIVVGLVLVALAQALALGNSGLDPRVAGVFLLIAIAPVALLIVLLTTGKRPTMWEQMD